MNNTEFGYGVFKTLQENRNNRSFHEMANAKHEEVRSLLIKVTGMADAILSDGVINSLSARLLEQNPAVAEIMANPKLAAYLKWLIDTSKKRYYLNLFPNGTYMLMRRDLSCVCMFGVVTVHEALAKYTADSVIVDVQHLYSFKKGEGKAIMQKIVNLSDTSGYTLALFTESESNIGYFEQFGFANHGIAGLKNDNWYMTYTPSHS